MKKYFIMISVLAFVGCNNAQEAQEAAIRENEIRQRTIDSIAAIDDAIEASRHDETHSPSSTTDNSEPTSTTPAKKKGMSKTTKGALIGTGAGIIGGAATGAAVSEDKGKGAVIGGVVGGAVGSGVGYGIGANEDKKDREKDTVK